MGERKVINKYIPADFDPSLVPRGKKLSSKDGTVPVRMMLPFSIQCSTCFTFLYRGRKFNSKKEAMGGVDGTYLGITRWRFYIKCTQCARPITILTDPKNADYEMESGGTRNYEVHRDKSEIEEAEAAEREATEKDDPMKALENRVLESQKEMADLDNLEEIRAMNARHVKLLGGGSHEIRTFLEKRKQLQTSDTGGTTTTTTTDSGALYHTELTSDDEELIRSIQFQNSAKDNTARRNNLISRLDEHDEIQLDEKRRLEAEALFLDHSKRLQQQQQLVTTESSASYPKMKTLGPSSVVIKPIKRRRLLMESDDPIVEDASSIVVTANDSNTLLIPNKNNNNNSNEKKGSLVRKDGQNSTTGTTSIVATTGDYNKPTSLAGLLGGYGSDSSSNAESKCSE